MALEWNSDGSNNVEPPEAKKVAGLNPEYPEAAQYMNWLLAGLVDGVNLNRDRQRLVHLPLKNDSVMRDGVGSVAFERAGEATYIDRYGVLQTAAIDELRYQDGLALLEPTATNEATYPNEFTHADWAKTNLGTPAQDQTGPDGVTNSGWSVLETAVDDSHSIVRSNITVSAGDIIVLGMRIKANSRRYGRLRIGTDIGFIGNLEYDLTGKVFTPSAGIDNWAARELTDGWWWIWATGTAQASSTTTSLTGLYVRGDAEEDSYLGDITKGVNLYGGQVLVSAVDFDSSYIPAPAGTPVTRVADSYLTIPYQGNSVRSDKPFAMLATVKLFGVNGLTQTGFNLSGEAPSPRTLKFATSSTLTPSATMPTSSTNGTASTANIPNRFGWRFDGTVLSLWRNGVKLNEVTPTTPLSTSDPTEIRVGQNVSGGIGEVELLEYAPTDYEMMVLTKEPA